MGWYKRPVEHAACVWDVANPDLTKAWLGDYGPKFRLSSYKQVARRLILYFELGKRVVEPDEVIVWDGDLLMVLTQEEFHKRFVWINEDDIYERP